MTDHPLIETKGPGGIRVQRAGEGEPVVFVHGGGKPGVLAWQQQLSLADRFELWIVTRLGYPPNPPLPTEDFEADAATIAELLGDGAHLVAHSYGAVGSLLAAAERPEAVWSLTLVEPGATSVALDDPVVARFEREMAEAVERTKNDGADAQVRAVFSVIEPGHPLPSPLPPPLADFGRRMPGLRWPREAVIPLERIASGDYPKLVVTGGGRPVYEIVAGRLVERTGARHVVVPGPHQTQDVGEPFNAVLESFLRESARTGAVR